MDGYPNMEAMRLSLGNPCSVSPSRRGWVSHQRPPHIEVYLTVWALPVQSQNDLSYVYTMF